MCGIYDRSFGFVYDLRDMRRILNIQETPLTSVSMNKMRFTAAISYEHAHHALKYYALDSAERSRARYDKGCQHVAKLTKNVYDSLVTDDTWSKRSRELFEAVNCGNIVSVTPADTNVKVSDLSRQNAPVPLIKSGAVIIEVRANAKLYWDHERELFAFSQQAQESVTFTTADPGPYLEYERRFMEAADDEDIGSVDVAVRKLVNGKAVHEMVRVVQKFVLNKETQYPMIQALYELCVWHFSVQSTAIAGWRAAEHKQDFSDMWADKMNKKILLIETLSQLPTTAHLGSTASNMDQQPVQKKGIDTVVKPKVKVTRFERYYNENKRTGITKPQLRLQFDALAENEKIKYGNPEGLVRPLKKRKQAVAEPVQEQQEQQEQQEELDPYAFLPCDKDGSDSDDDEEDGDYDVHNNPDDGDGDDCDNIVTTPPKDMTSPVAEKVTKLEQTKPRAAAKKPKSAAPSKKVQKVISKQIVHELANGGKAEFLWELLGTNMKAMVDARKPFTAFESTPFGAAYDEYLKDAATLSEQDRFKAAKRVLSKTPGIVHCFQMFNIMFSEQESGVVEDDTLMG
jgi:hypothetical protein